jgi:hypothetical protein
MIGSGPRTFRQETQEFRRIITGFFWLVVTTLLYLGMLWFNLILWGPWSVYALGFALIVVISALTVRRALRKRGRVAWAMRAAVFCALLGWLLFGFRVAEAALPPWDLRWELWTKVVVQFVVGVGIVVDSVVIWALYVEVVDPEHSMRHSGPQMANRLQPIHPTSVGVQGATPKVEYREIPSRTLRYERKRAGDEQNGWELGDVPNIQTREWWEFVRAVLADVDRDEGVTFSEPCAERFNIKGAEYRQTRDALIEEGFLAWRDEGNHNLGVELAFDEVDFWVQFAQQPPTPPKEWFVQQLKEAGL